MELEDAANDLKNAQNAMNTKLLSGKMSKEETARKLHELELMHDHKLKELKELQDRFK